MGAHQNRKTPPKPANPTRKINPLAPKNSKLTKRWRIEICKEAIEEYQSLPPPKLEDCLISWNLTGQPVDEDVIGYPNTPQLNFKDISYFTTQQQTINDLGNHSMEFDNIRTSQDSNGYRVTSELRSNEIMEAEILQVSNGTFVSERKEISKGKKVNVESTNLTPVPPSWMISKKQRKGRGYYLKQKLLSNLEHIQNVQDGKPTQIQFSKHITELLVSQPKISVPKLKPTADLPSLSNYGKPSSSPSPSPTHSLGKSAFIQSSSKDLNNYLKQSNSATTTTAIPAIKPNMFQNINDVYNKIHNNIGKINYNSISSTENILPSVRDLLNDYKQTPTTYLPPFVSFAR